MTSRNDDESIVEYFARRRSEEEAEWNALPIARYSYMPISRYRYIIIDITGAASREVTSPYKIYKPHPVDEFGNDVSDKPPTFKVLEAMEIVRKLNDKGQKVHES